MRRTCDEGATVPRRMCDGAIPVRATRRQLTDMATKREDLGDVLNDIACSEERSPLFWWLLEHHAEIAQTAKGRRMRWGPLLKRVLARGLTDGSGKSPTAETVRKTWWKVRREVAQTAELETANARAAAAKVQPSRLPAAWKPTPAELPRAPAAPRVESPAPHRITPSQA